MAWDDDWNKFPKNLPTRTGVPSGRSNERVQASQLGDNWNPRKSVRGDTLLVNGGGFSRFINEARDDKNTTALKSVLSGMRAFATAASSAIAAFYSRSLLPVALLKQFKKVPTPTSHFSCDGLLGAYAVDMSKPRVADDPMVPATHAEYTKEDGELRLVFGVAYDNEQNIVHMPAQETTISGDVRTVFGTNLHGKLWLQSHVQVGGAQEPIVGGPQATHPFVDTMGVQFEGVPSMSVQGASINKLFSNRALLYGSRKYYGVGEHTMELGYNKAAFWSNGRCYYIRAVIKSPGATVFASQTAGTGDVTVRVEWVDITPVLVLGNNDYGPTYAGKLRGYTLGYEFTVVPTIDDYIATVVAHFTKSGGEVDIMVNVEPSMTASAEDYAIQGYAQKNDYDIRLGVSVTGSGDAATVNLSPLPPLTSTPSNISYPVAAQPYTVGESYTYGYSIEFTGDYWWDSGIRSRFREVVTRNVTGTYSLQTDAGGHSETYLNTPTFYGQDRKFIKLTEDTSNQWAASISDPSGAGQWEFSSMAVYNSGENMWYVHLPAYGSDVVITSPPAIITRSGTLTKTVTVTQTLAYGGTVLATCSREDVYTQTESKNYACADFINAAVRGYESKLWQSVGGWSGGTWDGDPHALSGGPWLPGGTAVHTRSGTSLIYDRSRRISNNLIEITWSVTTHTSPTTGTSQTFSALVSPNGILTIRNSAFTQGRASWNPNTDAWFEIVGPTDENYDTWC